MIITCQEEGQQGIFRAAPSLVDTASLYDQWHKRYRCTSHNTNSPRESYTDVLSCGFPPRMARSSAMMVATTPSIFSVERCLSGLMFPAGSVRT